MPDEHTASHDAHDLTLQPIPETPHDMPLKPRNEPSPVPDAEAAAPEPEPEPVPGPESEPPANDDERLYAMLAHLLGLSWTIGVPGLVGPLVIYFWKKDESRFVAFHALQAFLLQVAVAVVLASALVAAPVASLAWMSFGLLLMPLVALALLAGLALLVYVVVTGMNAHKGQWAEYWIFGKIARLKVFDTQEP